MASVDTPQSACRFGVARCDITPPVGIYHRMWGAATHERATGVHRPLTATAMVFQAADQPIGPDTEQVMVAVDLCLLWAQEMDDLLRRLVRATGLKREQLAVTFSHTHAAGLMGLERSGLPGGDLIAPYLETLAQRIAGIIQEARRNVRDATIVYGTGRCRLAGHRDLWDEESRQFVCGFNPDGPSDDTVLVARIADEHSKPLATVVNYACHPTTLAWQNTLISPDFVGALRETVEGATSVPCVFIQGASGDIGPREGFVGDVAVADRNGRQLGYAALAALEALPPPVTRFRYAGPVVSGATIGTWAHQPLDADALEGMRRWQVKRWTVDLPYRADLSTLEQTQAEMQSWLQKEQAARNVGDLQVATDCRAMVERMTRRLTRLGNLPPGRTFPFPITLWRMGNAFWLAVEAELYNEFQRSLRQRFVDHPLVIATLTNGSRPSYLPTADVYGKGIYQESIAVLAPGCLERLVEEIASETHKMVR
jgi:hypothetical protein